MSRFRRSVYKVVTACVLVTLVIFTSLAVVAKPAAAATAPPELSLNVLLIGTGSTDPTTAAWQAALSSEGVSYTLATAAGTYGAETVTLPALTTVSVGNFNGVVIADSPAAFAAGQLTSLFTYESSYGVRQVDGYTAPYTGVGENNSSTTAVLDGTRRTAGPGRDGSVLHRLARLPGHRGHRSALHPVARLQHRGHPGRRLPAPEHRPASQCVRAGTELRLQLHDAPVAPARPRTHQLGDL